MFMHYLQIRKPKGNANSKFHLIIVRRYQIKHCVENVHIWSLRIQMRENTDQKNSEYGHFLNSEGFNSLRSKIRLQRPDNMILTGNV